MPELLDLLLAFIAGGAVGCLFTFAYVVVWDERMWRRGRGNKA